MAKALLLWILSCSFPFIFPVSAQGGDDAAPIDNNRTSAGALTLDYNSKEGAERAKLTLSNIHSNSSQIRQLRSINVTGYGSLVNISQINDVLRQLPDSLTDFHYKLNVPLPLDTIKIIEMSHSKCRIHYLIPFEYWDAFDDRVPDWGDGTEYMHQERDRMRRHILGSPNLYSIQANIMYGPQDNYDDLNLVHDILTDCSNLRELDLSLNHEGCIIADYPYAFDFSKNDKPLAPLEVLKLSGYQLNDPVNGRTMWSSLRRSTVFQTFMESSAFFNRVLGDLKGYLGMRQNRTSSDSLPEAQGARDRDNLDEWLDRMVWSNLRVMEIDLRLTSPDSLARIGSRLERLEQFVGHEGSSSVAAAYPAFFRSLKKPLDRVALWDLRASTYTDIITALSNSSLTSLTLTESEVSREYCKGEGCETPAYLTEPQIRQLALDHVSLSHLAFRVSRQAPNVTNCSTWSVDHASLRAAALLPNLARLDLYVESAESYFIRSGGARDKLAEFDWTREEAQIFNSDPSFNRTSISLLFRELNTLRLSKGLVPLSKLDVKVGLWDRRHEDGGMIGWPIRLIGRWTCEHDTVDARGFCFGGNQRMRDSVKLYPSELDDPYSGDWTKSAQGGVQ